MLKSLTPEWREGFVAADADAASLVLFQFMTNMSSKII